MKDILLLGKKVKYEESEILFKYSPDENFLKYFTPKTGEWKYEDGYLVGIEPGNLGGILLTNESFNDDVMLTFTVKAELPATRDLNAVWCAHWDEKTDYLGESYVCGLNGWYEGKSGIERNGKSPWELNEMVALCAPRAVLVLEPFNDKYNPYTSVVYECVQSAHKVYALLEHPERLCFYIHGDNHDTVDSVRELAYDFIDRFMK
jgi:hypothetical protein